MKRLLLILSPLAIALLIVDWTYVIRSKTPTNGNTMNVTMANPASTNCVDKGGKVSIVQGPKGEYGVCEFDDKRQCEEWAMFRGDCSVGGVKITGYTTQEARYCAIVGGDYTEKNDTCQRGKISCPAKQLYNGECQLDEATNAQ